MNDQELDGRRVRVSFLFLFSYILPGAKKSTRSTSPARAVLVVVEDTEVEEVGVDMAVVIQVVEILGTEEVAKVSISPSSPLHTH